MSKVRLYPHQKDAIDKLRNGSILCGGVGSGKSITAIAYFYTKVCNGSITNDVLTKPTEKMPLYIITTARKRDTLEWEGDCVHFGILRDEALSDIQLKVDSWNNIAKYSDVEHAFFIFDEQRVVGNGTWVKHFLKIAKKNKWILLSATPGDTWIDYIPVFIANGYYKNRTEFLNRHAVYSRFSKFPRIDRYVETGYLENLRRNIMVIMDYKRPTETHWIDISVDYDKDLFKQVYVGRWDPFEKKPLEDISKTCYMMRKVVNMNTSRIEAIRELMEDHKRIIIFYNFDFELDILRKLSSDIECSEWNGHKHDILPNSERWLYFVQYTAGAEGWNCINTDTIIFYSQNYSYKTMIQAAGRIDRMNTPYKDLYYYTLKSRSPIDLSIGRALKNKKTFNETIFLKGKNSR